jgi:hypothetical protein
LRSGSRNITWGILLILIGALLLAGRVLNLQNFDWSHLWPLILLVVGLSFELGYFISRRDPGVLVPGGILITLSVLFLFETYTDWNYSDRTWPFYTLAVSVGLFQLYLFGGKKKGVFIAASILGIIFLISGSTVFFNNIFPWANASLILPIILIVLGVVVLLRNFKDKE